MGQLLSLLNRPDGDFLDFLAIRNLSAELTEQLSPTWMRINSELVLVDLFPVRDYWLKRAQDSSQSVIELWGALFPQARVIAVQAAHPLQALILCEFLKQRHVQGFFSIESPLLAKNYHYMSWEVWKKSLAELHRSFQEQNILGKEIDQFRKEEKALLQLLQNIGALDFSQLKAIHFWQIQRRFGAWMGQLWQWTFPNMEKGDWAKDLFSHFDRLKGFPWRSEKALPPWQVQRDLDWLVHDWGVLQEFLLIDFAKLQGQQSFGGAGILQMEWSVIWSDGDSHTQSLDFRQPLFLQQDGDKNFSTLRQQFELAFTSIQRGGEGDGDFFCLRWLQAYQIKVTQITPSGKGDTLPLHLDLRQQQADEDDLMSLANRLQGELMKFEPKTVSVHLQDYQTCDLRKSENLAHQASIRETRALDPLYIHQEPKLLTHESLRHRYFIKRVSGAWWQDPDKKDEERDCFFCQLQDGRLIFAYRDQMGKWFEYGYS